METDIQKRKSDELSSKFQKKIHWASDNNVKAIAAYLLASSEVILFSSDPLTHSSGAPDSGVDPSKQDGGCPTQSSGTEHHPAQAPR